MAAIVLKSLKKTDIEKQIALRSKFLESFPPLSGDKHMMDFHMRDESGHVWEFRIYARKNNRKCPKPILTRGWREFVCSKQLRTGDRVAFYMEKEEADCVKIRVKVEKAVKAFGVVFGHKAIPS